MAKADRVLSTPPTNTSANNLPGPVDPTRRRFLTIAAIASAVGAGSLAIAAAAPSIPQAVQISPSDPSPALRSAIRFLAMAHEDLIAAQATNEEAEAMMEDWEAKNPAPTSRKGKRRWRKRATAERDRLLSEPWQGLMEAEIAFARAQTDVAKVPIASLADLRAMATCSVAYDGIELARVNRALIAQVVANAVFGKAVRS
jgi:hypothetical protein